MKKLFGGINLTWKNLIIFSIVVAIYTALMATLPFTKDTSFRDIAILLEWWIVFGIIIISNSKSPMDSALKCFVFFLISQPLIYLIQVPFSHMGWKLFSFYKYWFLWTLACFPMGYIGYYIKKKNVISMIILLPMIIALVYLGEGYLKQAIDVFPHHLLSAIFCFVSAISIVLILFDKWLYKIILIIIAVLTFIYLFFFSLGKMYDKFVILDEYHLELEGEVSITSFTSRARGDYTLVSIINREDGYSLRVVGYPNKLYELTIGDMHNHEYSFTYTFDKEGNLDLKLVE